MRDQKMAHLISLGGWLRGLEICAGAVETNYSTDRAAVLWQRDLINYFAEELKTLPPAVAHKPLFEKIRSRRRSHPRPAEPRAGKNKLRGCENAARPGKGTECGHCRPRISRSLVKQLFPALPRPAREPNFSLRCPGFSRFLSSPT